MCWLHIMMPWPLRLNDNDGLICINGSDDVRRQMMMTNYAQLFVFGLHWLQMKLYGFADFVEQHLMPYEYAGISLAVIEASMWLL